MTTSTAKSSLTLLDTNILVYATDEASEYHRASRTIVEEAKSHDASLCVAPQTMAEFYAVVTNPRRVHRPRLAEEAFACLRALMDAPGIVLLPIPADVVGRWLDLAERHPVKGQEIFDLQLIATMLGNGVKRIYTYNRSDFEWCSEIEVLTP